MVNTQSNSKLNPSAPEFFPASRRLSPQLTTWSNLSCTIASDGPNHSAALSSYSGGNSRPNRAKRIQERIRKTVYVSEIDRMVNEADLVNFFSRCGPIKEGRICGDTKSGLRFGFVEFLHRHSAREALRLDRAIFCILSVRVLKSCSAIVPVNPNFLPQSEEEKELVSRTVFCANVDRTLREHDLKEFFESCSGEVSRIKFLTSTGTEPLNTLIEFSKEEFAMKALTKSGTLLGITKIRITSARTPIRTWELQPVID